MNTGTELLIFGGAVVALGLAGYTGVKAVQGLDFPKLFNSGSVGTSTSDEREKALAAARNTGVESTKVWQEYEDILQHQGYLEAHPEYARALNDYQKEADEYTLSVKNYDGESWGLYKDMQKEYGEALSAYDRLLALYTATTSPTKYRGEGVLV